MPKTTNWNTGIQILRGIAATLVVFHHSLEESLAISPHVAPDWLIRLGAGGVDIFFVISGFIIYSVTYGREPGNPEQAPLFLAKRFMRIFPLYWICLLVTLALWASGHFYRSLHIDGTVLGSSLFLLPSKKMIVGVAWTLVYEMYFYYLFALTLFIRNALASVLGTIALIGAGLLLSHLLPVGAFRQFLSDPIALEFCYGLILAYCIHSKVLGGAWLRHLWLPGLLLMAAGAAFGRNNGGTAGLDASVRFLAWGLPALLVTVSFIKMEFVKALPTRSVLPVGDASYSIYLTHPTLMIVFASLIHSHLLRPIPCPIIWPLFFSMICLLLGLLIHYWIERPILAWLRGCLAAKLARDPAPVAGVRGPAGGTELISSAKNPL
jgi:exopolysaccharide production protein ExoZ